MLLLKTLKCFYIYNRKYASLENFRIYRPNCNSEHPYLVENLQLFSIEITTSASIFSRPYLSNSRAFGTVVVRPSVCPFVCM